MLEGRREGGEGEVEGGREGEKWRERGGGREVEGGRERGGGRER